MIKTALKEMGIRIYSENEKEMQFLCPFHDDTNPSASINKKSGLWICYGCDRRGNIFTISKKNRVDLKDKYELRNKMLESEIESFINKETKALDYYFFPRIFKKIKSELDCPEYLLGRLNIETILHFNLHICDDIESEFAERIIIPIEYNENLGFIGRDYTNTSSYKYLIPKGMPKSKFIFGDLKHKELIIVEGTFDAMKLWENGFKNTISILGASINKTQIDYILDSGVQSLIIFGDGDDAGRKMATSFIDYSNLFKLSFMKCFKDKDPFEMTEKELNYAYENKINLNTKVEAYQMDRNISLLEEGIKKSKSAIYLFPN